MHSGSPVSVLTFIFSPEFSDVPDRVGGRARRETLGVPAVRHVDPADHALIVRVREHGEAEARAALDILYANMYDRLVRFAMRLVDGDVAYDVVQDVFVSIWLTRATWHAPAGSLAYCYSAVRNRALKRIRHDGVVQRVWSVLANTPEFRDAPDRHVEDAEFDAALSAALAQLPERRRTAFLLRAVDGLSYDAIGAVLGVSGPAAFKQVTAAVRVLRERLGRFAG